MSQERRSHPRYGTDLPANLRVPGHPEIPCRVRNYSQGGLFLELDSSSLPVVDGSLQGRVVFSGAASQLPELEVRLAFVSAAGSGVAFLQPVPGLLELMGSAVQSETSGSPVTRENDLLDRCREQQQAFISARLDTFYSALESHYLALADNANQQAQGDLLRAAKTIASEKSRITQGYGRELQQQWQEFLEPRLQGPQGRLELVDQEEFDEWAELVR